MVSLLPVPDFPSGRPNLRPNIHHIRLVGIAETKTPPRHLLSDLRTLAILTSFVCWVGFREQVPAQPVDATPANRLLRQHFSQGTDLSELYSIKPRQDSAFRVY
jgi:hypothetical protein